jgi:hypothetical protein
MFVEVIFRIFWTKVRDVPETLIGEHLAQLSKSTMRRGKIP